MQILKKWTHIPNSFEILVVDGLIFYEIGKLCKMV